MAKKTNKTSHVLNLISNRTGLPEEEIAPETSSKKQSASQSRSVSPQTVEDLLAEDIPAAPQDQYQKKEPLPESSMTEENSEKHHLTDRNEEPHPTSLSGGSISVPSNSDEMNIPSSPKAFADAISAAQQALADTLPPEQRPSTSAPHHNPDSHPSASEMEQNSVQSTKETYDHQEPPVPANIAFSQSQMPEDERPIEEEAHGPVLEQPYQSAAKQRTFADMIPSAQKEAERPATFAEMLFQANPTEQNQPQPISATPQYMGQPPYPTQGYQTAPQIRQGFYSNQGAPRSAAEYVPFPTPQHSGQSIQYHQTPQQTVAAQQQAQFQTMGQPTQMQMPAGQPMSIPQHMQAQMPQQPFATQQPLEPQRTIAPQMPGYQPALAPYPAPSTPERSPEITPYDGPKTAQPSLINALFGKPGSKKAASALMDEEIPDPRLFQPFDISSAILKNIEDYVDHSAGRSSAASAGSADPKKESTAMNETPVKSNEKISLKKDAFQDPSKSYTFLARNIMEDLIINQMFAIMQKFDMCTCNKCVNDVLALSLNSLPPKYVVSKQTSLYVKLAACEKQYDTDIVSAITQACVLVQKNPRHESRD